MREPTAYLVATFSRCRAEPRSHILVTFFNRGEEEEQDDDDDTKAAARARAWPFTTRASMIEVLADADSWGVQAYTLVFWPGNNFQPPMQVEVSKSVKSNTRYDGVDFLCFDFSRYMGSFDAAVSFALSIPPPAGYDQDHDKSTAEAVIDKVLEYVGELPKADEGKEESEDEESEDDEEEEGSKKREKRAKRA